MTDTRKNMDTQAAREQGSNAEKPQKEHKLGARRASVDMNTAVCDSKIAFRFNNDRGGR